MVTSVWDQDFVYSGPLSVRVSCHAGDFGQTAICNAIGDQPLFYLDDYTDDDLFLDLLPEGMMESMETKLHTYDKAIKSLSTHKTQSTETQFDQIIKQSRYSIVSIADIVAYGMQSGLFQDYYNNLTEQGLSVISSDITQNTDYDKDLNIITINTNLGLLNGSIALFRMMRTAWHYHQGILINPLVFQPEEAVLINRLFAADLDVMETAFLWDLKLAGCHDAWNIAMGSADYDLHIAYAIEAMSDFRTIKGGLAARATFEKWFISDRCKNHDRDIIQIMLGNHTAYKIEAETTSRHVAQDIIRRLGDQPRGKNYLAALIPNLMTDSLYTDVRDRSNANFLWFVSFERRMSDMEQELQLSDEASQTGFTSTKDNVYELPTYDGSNTTEKTENTVATLFFLDHFRAG